MQSLVYKLPRKFSPHKIPKIAIVLIIIFTIAICTRSVAQENQEMEYPGIRIGLNFGLKFENPYIQKSGFKYTGSPKLRSNSEIFYIQFFLAKRIGHGWYINSGLSYLPSQTFVNATYSFEEVNREFRLTGQLRQNILSFSWKVEYWLNKTWYVNTGPAANFVVWNSYENNARNSKDYIIEDDWVSGQNSYFGVQSNVGAVFSLETIRLQANIGYLWGPHSAGIGSIYVPNLIHQIFSFRLGMVTEF